MVNVQASFRGLAPLGSNKVPCKNTFIEIPDYWAESEGAFLQSLPQRWKALPPPKAEEAMPMKRFDLHEIPKACQHQWTIKNSFIEVKDLATDATDFDVEMPTLERSLSAPEEDNSPKEALQHLVLGVGGHLVENLRLDADRKLVESEDAMRAEHLCWLSVQDVDWCIKRTSQNSYARWFLGREIRKAAKTNFNLKDCIEELSDQEDKRWYSLHVVMSGKKYQSLIWSGHAPPRHPDPSETMSKRGWEKACSAFRNYVPM